MTEYEKNRQDINEYREKFRENKVIQILCSVMEWFDEHCIKVY